MVSLMSTISKEKRRSVRGEEELKRRLKSKPELPRVEPEKASVPKVGLRSKLKTSIPTIASEILKERPPPPSRTLSKRTPARILKPLSDKMKRRVNVVLKPIVAKRTIQAVEGVTARTIVKHEALKIEVKKPMMPRPTESSRVSRLTMKPPKIDLRFPVRRLVKTEPKLIKRAIFTAQETHVGAISPRIPKPIEEAELPVVRDEEEKWIELAEEVIEPDFLKALGGFAKPIGRPVCIVLSKTKSESYVHSVALTCREIYRIVEGGKPKPRWLSEGSKEEIEEYMKAGDMIFVVDDSKCRMLPNFSKIEEANKLFERVRESKLFDRLRELFSQDYGFIIFHVSDRFKNEFTRMLRENVGRYVKIVELSSKGLLKDVKEEIARMCWGFVDAEGETFDELFGSAEKKYYEELIRISEDIELMHWMKRDPEASLEHEALKAFVIKAVARELRAKSMGEIVQMLERGVIKTEYEFEGRKSDVYVCPADRHLEVETFYGTGDPITDKLDNQTLAKYRGEESVDVVLLGLHALLYAGKLLELARVYRKHHGLNVNFYIPDLKSGRLIPLHNVLDRLNQLKLYPHEGMDFDEAKRAYEHLLKKKLSETEVADLYYKECERNNWEQPEWVLRMLIIAEKSLSEQ